LLKDEVVIIRGDLADKAVLDKVVAEHRPDLPIILAA